MTQLAFDGVQRALGLALAQFLPMGEDAFRCPDLRFRGLEVLFDLPLGDDSLGAIKRLLQIVGLALCMIFPEIITWLPSLMMD